MKTNSATTTLRKNQSSGHQPVFAPSQIEIGHGARQPPRNSVAASAETVTMLMYSARKNSANLSDEYSVWKPPTSSLSAAARSNGARLVSPTAAMTEMTKETGSRIANQRGPVKSRPKKDNRLPSAWAATISEVDIE